MTDKPAPIYRSTDLVSFATALFEAAGLDADKAATVGLLLVEADLIGHTTHGLQLAGAYLGAIEQGDMATSGAPSFPSTRGLGGR